MSFCYKTKKGYNIGKMKVNLLLIDDDTSFLKDASEILKADFNVITAEGGKKGINAFQSDYFNVVLLDLMLPDMHGFEVLEKIKEMNPFVPVIIITGYADVEKAVEAMKRGADDFIPKDFNLGVLREKIKKLLETRDLKISHKFLKSELEHERNEFIYASEVMKKIIIELEKIVNLDLDVLLVGETGVGKDLMARQIHEMSKRRDKNFVPVNIAGIEPNLVDSELFGTVKGAFTDAINRVGRFELAQNGTLYLSEIAEIPHNVQIKLLYFLQYKEITRVGSNKGIKLDVRLIFATNADIEKLRKEGKIRDDFYYRIAGTQIYIPPLRERVDDIIPLARYFIKKYCLKYGIKKDFELSEELKSALLSYHWPGNVRELESMIMSSIRPEFEMVDELRLEHFPYLFSVIEDLKRGKDEFEFKPYKIAEREFKKSYFSELFKRVGGDIKSASKVSGLSQKYLQRVFKSLGLI